MPGKAFASSADLAAKEQTLEVLADGVYALTAEGDPNVGAIEGEDFLVCVEAMATPVAARGWLSRLRQHTDKPVRYLVLSHYHAVRVLGASAFGAETIVTHEKTRELIGERGRQDWESEYARMPRLFKEPASIPGLTWPTALGDQFPCLFMRNDDFRAEGARTEHPDRVVMRKHQVANGLAGVLAEPGQPLTGGHRGCHGLEADQEVLALDRAHVRVALGGQRVNAVGEDLQGLFLRGQVRRGGERFSRHDPPPC